MPSLKLTTIGSSAGVILPGEILAHLGVETGGTLYVTEAPDGSYRLTSVEPENQRQISLAEDIMREDWDILRALVR